MLTNGNTILITGGGTGIGRGLAEAFHAKGNQVIIAGRRRAVLEDVAHSNPGMAIASVDMADAASITTLAASVAATYPALNVVIHNAGVMLAEDMLTDGYTSEQSEAMIATNLVGPIRLTAALLPQLKAQARASIVTVSSGLAFVPLVITPTYNATKAALHSWTQSLRSQLSGTAIDVLEIVPPAVATDLMPGHAENTASMPLDAYVAEVMALIEANPDAHEICVERVGFLRTAERSGQYDTVYAMLNQSM